MRFSVTQFFRLHFAGSPLVATNGCLIRRAGWHRALTTLLLLVSVAPVVSFGQAQNAGTISGNVTDSQGGIVINATATLTSTDEGNAIKVKVNGRGEYIFSDVKSGSYTLTVSAPTFQNFTADSVAVNANENVRMDAKLIRGSANDTVTVDAPSATVDTRSATIATVIDPTLVQDLPVDGSNVVALAALLPGVTNVNAPTTFTSDTGGPTYNVSGSRSNQNLFLFDGMLWNNVYLNTGLNYPPPFMLSEVSVLLVNFKAQYGRNVGSVFNALTHEGTNMIHGTLWEYMQNAAFNAADYMSERNPHLVQNQFGATMGGPILRDKIFFFLGYQDLRSSAEVDAKSQTPTLNERGLLANGSPRPCVSTSFAGLYCASFAEDFAPGTTQGLRRPDYANSSYLASAISEITATARREGQTGTPQCLTDLARLNASGQTEYILTQELPSSCFDPVAVNTLARYVPLPNQPNENALPYTNTHVLQPRNDQNGLARVDWNLGRHTLDGRFYVTNTNDMTSNGAGASGLTIANYEISANDGGIYYGNLGDTWVIRPDLLNIARIGYKRYNYTITPTDQTTLTTLGANPSDTSPPAGTHPSLPRMEATNRFTLGSTNSTYSYNVNANFEADDSLNYTHGNHNFQFGAQYLDLQYIHRFDQTPFLEAETQNTEVSSADFLMGLTYQETFGNTTNISALQHAFYFYAQDDWRATSRLTLNLGLRYELPKPWYQPDGQSVTFIPYYQSYRFVNAPSSLAYQDDPGVPNSIIKTNYTNFAPRFGFAYDVFGDGKTSLRGGFGIFYDTLNANTVGIGEPYHYSATYTQPPGGFSDPLLNLSPVPANYTTPASAQFASPQTINFADSNVTEPYVEAVNFGLQQHIAAATLELIYVGKFGRHAIVPYDLNPAIYDCTGSYFQVNPTLYCPGGPGGATSASAENTSYVQRVRYPGFNYGGQGIVDNNTVGTSNYNGLQIIYIQRSRKSLNTIASYTYSRSLDDQSSGTTNVANVPLSPNVNTNYAPSDYQATHVVNFGWIYRLPSPVSGPLMERIILQNWTFGGIFNARTGNPFNPTLAGDHSLTDERTERPPFAPGYTHYVGLASGRHRSLPIYDPTGRNNGKIEEWFNVNAFNGNPPYGYSNMVSRNLLYGPAFIESDFSIRRLATIPYRAMQMELRVDAFNVFNTPNLANPQASYSSTASTAANNGVGEIVATVGKNGAVGTNGRRLQLGLILHY
jgi:outer membrane receptor protein involved in Fe transport